MLKNALLLLCLVLGAGLPGCLYAKVRIPLDDDVDKTELGNKEGHSDITTCLWLFSWGDAGTAAAAKNGNMTRINHLDAEYFIVLFGLYGRRSTIAYGD